MRILIGVLAIAACGCSLTRDTHAGFWFEPVTYASARLGGRVTPAEMAVIEGVARAELARAFQGLNLALSDRRNARYRVRVVPEVRDQRMQRDAWVAGEARAAAGFGGIGAVSFIFLANGAMVYSPESATRDELVRSIGLGIGRAAAHELAHQLLPKADIHDTANRRSYEYGSAARIEQYTGDMQWDIAAPLLLRRLGSGKAGPVAWRQ